jgi:competence ComEA-like helix-hairpin-helix protein
MQFLTFRHCHRYLALLLSLGLTACQQARTQPTQTPTPLPQDSLIQVYTNHEPTSSYTEPYRKQTRPGDDLEQIIADTISTAHTSVDVAVQELRLPKIAAALVARKQAGVSVRVILENTYSRPYSSFTAAEIAKVPERERDRYNEARQLMDRNGDGQLSQEEIEQGDALVMLDRAQIPRIDDRADGSAGSNLMHHKFVVVDGRTVIVTSANFTTSDIHGDFAQPASRGNANNLLKIDSPDLATLFSREFAILWGDGPGGKPDSRFGVKKPVRAAQQVTVGSTLVEVQFSPTGKSVPWDQSSSGLIGKTLSTAKRSIDLALFVFSEQPLVNLLDKIHQNGVEIRALIEPEFAYRPYSEALDMLGITLAEENCTFQADNRPWQNPIMSVGVPRLPPGDLLHHKFGIVDQDTVITGSHNWTDSANLGNDETVLVLHSSVVAAHYQREFERLYSDAILGIPPAIEKKVDAQQQRCPQMRSQPSQPTPTPHATRRRDPTKSADSSTQRSPTSHATRRRDPTKSADSSTQRRSPKSTHRKSKQKSPSHELVNLNTASQEELETLPGVGPRLAQRIIAARQDKRLSSLNDLDHIPGLSSKKLENLRDRVTF